MPDEVTNSPETVMAALEEAAGPVGEPEERGLPGLPSPVPEPPDEEPVEDDPHAPDTLPEINELEARQAQDEQLKLEGLDPDAPPAPEEEPVEDLSFPTPGTLNVDTVKRAAPELFEKMPELEKVIQEHAIMRSVADSPEDVAKMANDSEMYQNIVIDLRRGDLSGMFSSMAQHTPNSWNAIKQNVLDNLEQAEPGAADQIFDSQMRKSIGQMMNEAESRNDARLFNACAAIAYRRWQTTDLREAPETDRERQLRETMEGQEKSAKEESVRGQYEQLQLVFGKQATGLIEDGFKRFKIDANPVYNDWVFNELELQVARDQNFMQQARMINERALELGQYSERAMRTLQRGYLSAVRKNLPEVLKKLKGAGASNGNGARSNGAAPSKQELTPPKSVKSRGLRGQEIPSLDKIDPSSFDGPSDLLAGNFKLK